VLPTARHINPALAIAGAIKKADPTAEIHFAGRKEGMEYRLVTQAGYPFHHIEITGFQRKLSLNNIKRNLIVSPYDPRFLKQGAFGIWEPGDTRETDPGSIDWIIVPGVAFDKKLNRLGRGKGYYDKLLVQTSATKIGICYELQLFDEIPAEPHDIKMDFIITENNIIHRKDELWH
jgi:hypothetical protein